MEKNTQQLPAADKIGVTVLGSGSKGNCTLVHCGREAIMIDAGFSCRETKSRLLQAGMSGMRVHAILVTHEHTDHVNGLRVCAEALDVPVYATPKCATVLRGTDSRLRQFATFTPGSPFDISCFDIDPFPIPHDACDPVGFIICCHGVKIAVATDIGFISSCLEYELDNCDMMVVESNHDLRMLEQSSRPWNLKQRIMGRQGHLCNEATQDLLRHTVKDSTRNIILAHLSAECNTPELARHAAQETLNKMERSDVGLFVASQTAPLPTVWSR
ncbi:MAG: MBL fold metallo-hydrolase [Victivallales bacterium]|nr:MBL fold metallo-hydrolase [Victivallales bacterium]